MNHYSFPGESTAFPLAVATILILLCLAALSGGLLARVLIKNRIRQLEALLEERKFELSEYRTKNRQNLDIPIAMNATKTVYPHTSPDHEPDDLKVVEGIGPKIEEILNKEGIHTYEQLAESSVLRIAGILKKAGPRFQIQDPSSWPRQGALAKDRKWEELQAFKTKLLSGELSH
jgi:predicted flap endonuclease-1-like 5' DNA nuclease